MATVNGTGGALDERGLGIGLAWSVLDGGNEVAFGLGPVDVTGNIAEALDLFSREDLGLTCCVSGVESERSGGRTTGVEACVGEPALVTNSGSAEGVGSACTTPVKASSCRCMLRSFLVSESTFATSFLRSFNSLGNTKS